ncbi:uncharacterized GPI-anchored protein At3g06035 isoform X2 [Populus alba]|uniref:Uncharacterized GPI-anchored protein At5g19230-like domain-containing protein n=2 Tax=Populus TaxID=3689 RepID=A0A4U5Q3I3_POPAL|nr:uncharacterized GPI-anchored protein At3g06035-like isoform X2 [Populus alba]KAJ6989003.1 hypothetical protein NC653_021789 [Populus alba x Populus x berolinensis]TKS04132.1 hypothetical protein D5086_0000146870 [Populus alba]
MASSRFSLLFPFFVFFIILCLISHPVICDGDEEDALLQGINNYRTSFNLTTLTKNDNAECLAEEIADQFKNQPCTNTTGSNTVPGTEPQFPNYPSLLAKCHLNVSNTRDGAVMPACVPNLDPSLVLTNFTRTSYSDNLNDTKFTGAGIGSDGNWIVVVLTTSTPEGSFVTSKTDGSDSNAANLTAKNTGLIYHLLFLLIGSLFML